MKTKKTVQQQRKLNWIGCPSESVYLGWLEILDKGTTQAYTVLEWIHAPVESSSRVFLLRKDKTTMYEATIKESQDDGKVATCTCPAGKRYKKKQCKHVAALSKLIERGQI